MYFINARLKPIKVMINIPITKMQSNSKRKDNKKILEFQSNK